MHFLVAGVSHNSAPMERLQRLAINRRALPELIRQGTLHLGDVVILSTCNRTEIYSVADDTELGLRRLMEFLEQIDERLEPGADPLTPYVYTLSDDDPATKLVTDALRSLGLEPSMHPSGGGTDGNVFRRRGISAVVVGMADHDMHTVRESVTIPDLVDAAHLCETLLRA